MLNRCLLIVSDLHCGSIFGMLPPNLKTGEGVVKLQNPVQRYLWECWQHYLETIRGIAPQVAAVVLNGDLLDGMQQAQRGTELSLPIPADQVWAAEAVLKPLQGILPSVPWYSVQGTEYHDGRVGMQVEQVSRTLGCLEYGTILNGTGTYCREFLDLEIDGVTFNVMHEISPSTGFYRATALDREAQWSAITAKEGRVPKADCVIRSHVHCFTHVEHSTKHAVSTPCWQAQTRFMRRKSRYRMLPDIGGIIVWFEGELKKRGEDPIVVRKVLYPLPGVEATKL